MKEMIIEVLDLALKNPIAFLLYTFGVIFVSILLAFILSIINDKLEEKSATEKKAKEDEQKEVKKKSKECISKKKRRELEGFYYYTNRLFNELLFYCYNNDIIITYCRPGIRKDEPFAPDSSSEYASGYISYSISAYTGNYRNHKIFIRLSPKDNKLDLRPEFEYSRTIFTLTHEVGHAISMINYHDDSEEGADLEGYKFCKSLMEPDEEKNIEIISWIEGYFGNAKNYQHPLKSYESNNSSKYENSVECVASSSQKERNEK